VRFQSLLVGSLAAAALLGPGTGAARAQDNGPIRIGSPSTQVMSRSTARSEVLMTATNGAGFDALAREGDWFWVLLPADAYGTRRAGWIYAGDVEGAVLKKPLPVKEHKDGKDDKVTATASAEADAANGTADQSEPADARAAAGADDAQAREAAKAARKAEEEARAAQKKADREAEKMARKAAEDERRLRKAQEELEKARQDYEKLVVSRP
jgi:hypothetical protein